MPVITLNFENIPLSRYVKILGPVIDSMKVIITLAQQRKIKNFDFKFVQN